MEMKGQGDVIIMKLGFIGTGFMGSAMLRGVLNSGLFRARDLYIYDVDNKKTAELSKELGINIASSEAEVAEFSDAVILAVKPDVVKSALEACKDKFNHGRILISIAAGIPLKTYRDILGNQAKVVRAMPNLPAVVGEGMTVFSFSETLEEKDIDTVKKILGSFGKVEVLDESRMCQVIALTSSSPAYVFMFIEAMADAAVLSGISRQMAYRLAAQAVLGSAKMVLETGRHPGELKDQVCSPGGTTIEAVSALEKNGFRYAVIEAMDRCTKKAEELGKLFG